MTDPRSEFSLRDRCRSIAAGWQRMTAGWSRPVALLALVGLLVCLASIGFPFYALDGYAVSSQQLEEPPEFEEENRPTVVEYEELSRQERRIVQAAIEGAGPVVYAPFYAHQEADGPLPRMFSDTWIDEYEVGAVVHYQGSYYEVGTYGSVPFHFAIVVPAGLVIGLGLLAIAWLSTRRGWRQPPAVAAAVGLLVLALLLWIGNVSGYVWQVQY